MNRRGFLAGAISVMAIAAVLKGRPTGPPFEVSSNLDFHEHIASDPLVVDWDAAGLEIGDYIKVDFSRHGDRNGLYKVTSGTTAEKI
jgi:hypothetical protein